MKNNSEDDEIDPNIARMLRYLTSYGSKDGRREEGIDAQQVGKEENSDHEKTKSPNDSILNNMPDNAPSTSTFPFGSDSEYYGGSGNYGGSWNYGGSEYYGGSYGGNGYYGGFSEGIQGTGMIREDYGGTSFEGRNPKRAFLSEPFSQKRSYTNKNDVVPSGANVVVNGLHEASKKRSYYTKNFRSVIRKPPMQSSSVPKLTNTDVVPEQKVVQRVEEKDV